MYDVSLLMKANSRIQKRRPMLQDGHFIFVSDEPFFDEYALAEFMAFCNRIVHGGYPKGIPVAFCGTQRPLVRWSSGRCAV